MTTMVIHQPGRLHEGVADGGADKTEAAPPQFPAHGLRLGTKWPAVGFVGCPFGCRLWSWPSTKAPDEVGKTCPSWRQRLPGRDRALPMAESYLLTVADYFRSPDISLPIVGVAHRGLFSRGLKLSKSLDGSPFRFLRMVCQLSPAWAPSSRRNSNSFAVVAEGNVPHSRVVVFNHQVVVARPAAPFLSSEHSGHGASIYRTDRKTCCLAGRSGLSVPGCVTKCTESIPSWQPSRVGLTSDCRGLLAPRGRRRFGMLGVSRRHLNWQSAPS